MARRPFSLLRAMCAYRAEAFFVAAFVFMLLHDSVGVRHVVVHTTTASTVRHEIGRHEHSERRHARERLRVRPTEPARIAVAPRTVRVSPRRTSGKVRTVEPARAVRVTPLPRRGAVIDPTPSVRVSPPSPVGVSGAHPVKVRVSAATRGSAASAGTRVREEGVHVLVPPTAAVTF